MMILTAVSMSKLKANNNRNLTNQKRRARTQANKNNLWKSSFTEQAGTLWFPLDDL